MPESSTVQAAWRTLQNCAGQPCTATKWWVCAGSGVKWACSTALAAVLPLRMYKHRYNTFETCCSGMIPTSSANTGPWLQTWQHGICSYLGLSRVYLSFMCVQQCILYCNNNTAIWPGALVPQQLQWPTRQHLVSSSGPHTHQSSGSRQNNTLYTAPGCVPTHSNPAAFSAANGHKQHWSKGTQCPPMWQCRRFNTCPALNNSTIPKSHWQQGLL